MRRLPWPAACVLAVVSVAAALPAAPALPPVYLYHDDAYANYGYLQAPKAVTLVQGGAWPIAPGGNTQASAYHRGMMRALAGELTAAGVPGEPLDAAGWLALCRSGRRAIVVTICQNLPDLIFSGQAEGSPLETWLDGGGILVYSGDWPFYWYTDRSGKGSDAGAGVRGDDAIFDADLVRDGMVGITCQPTEQGARALPSLRGTWTLRPFDLDAVERACPSCETYLQGERTQDGLRQRAADGLCFRLPHGSGSFVGLHFERGPHGDTAQVVLEFLTGRARELFGGEAR